MPQKQSGVIESLREEMRKGINSVIVGDVEEFDSPNPIYPELVENYLKPIGWKRGDLDTNGWQYDWWLPFTKGGKSFTAHGSGYYGGFNFSKTEVP